MGLIPGIGILKNADEAGAILKGTVKNAEEAGTALKIVMGSTGEAAAPLKGISRNADEAAGLVSSSRKAANAAEGMGETARAVAGEPDEMDKAIDAIWNSGDITSNAVAEGAGKTGSLDGLTPAERKMIDDLTKQGKNVETIPRSNVSGGKTPDFNVNNVKTELKTMQNPNTNTGMKRIQEGFGQGAETVIIDARGSGLTRTQASEIINRAKGKYLNGQLPGKVEIWIDGQIITYP